MRLGSNFQEMRLGSIIQRIGCVWSIFGSMLSLFPLNNICKINPDFLFYWLLFFMHPGFIIIMWGFRANRVFVDGQKYTFRDIIGVFKYFSIPQRLLTISCFLSFVFPLMTIAKGNSILILLCCLLMPLYLSLLLIAAVMALKNFRKSSIVKIHSEENKTINSTTIDKPQIKEKCSVCSNTFDKDILIFADEKFYCRDCFIKIINDSKKENNSNHTSVSMNSADVHHNTTNSGEIVSFCNQKILIDSFVFFHWKEQNPLLPIYEFLGIIPLTEKEPVIELYEDGVKTREYCLQTEGEEDFNGKYFHISVRLSLFGKLAVPAVQIDGFISDTAENQKMSDNIGFRMEAHFLNCGGDNAVMYREMYRGKDLPAKGLKYIGYITPANVRLIGICPVCHKSFAFHSYACYMEQCNCAYSDDGLDVCKISENGIDKENWFYKADGKVFRYYNSFNCPHCGTPYIDYKTYKEMKVFGVSACVHLGRKYYQSD